MQKEVPSVYSFYAATKNLNSFSILLQNGKLC